MDRLKNANYLDDVFPRSPFKEKRLIVRAVVFDETNKVAIHRIKRNDAFGDASYYETPGGGVDEGETLLEALERECHEELGISIDVLDEIGIVNDEYALIGRENENHYYIAKKIGDGSPNLVSEGDMLIEKTVWIPLEEAISLYESLPDSGIEKLLKQRELPILRFSKKLFDEGKLSSFLDGPMI